MKVTPISVEGIIIKSIKERKSFTRLNETDGAPKLHLSVAFTIVFTTIT